MDGTIILEQTYLGQQVRNVLVFSNVEDTDAFRTGFVAGLQNLYTAHGTNTLQESLLTTWALNSVRFYYNDISIPEPYGISVPMDPPIEGIASANVSTQTASQVALLVSLQRSGPPPNRGRIYFAGAASNQIDANGRWLTGYMQRFADVVAEMAANGVGGAFLRIGRRNAEGKIIMSSPVETVVARSNPAIQRRRRLGQGI